MAVIRCYPDVPRVRRMFKGVKVKTVPNQCMTLQEMLRRFVRREALPVAHDGIYVESDYDLEKFSNEDRVFQDEIVKEVKVSVAAKKAKAEEALKQRDPKEAVPKPVEPTIVPT